MLKKQFFHFFIVHPTPKNVRSNPKLFFGSVF